MSEEPGNVQELSEEPLVEAKSAPLTETYDVIYANGRTYIREKSATPARRRVVLPIILLLCTCVTTFWVGVSQWRLFPLGIAAPSYGDVLTDEHLDYFRAFFVPAHWNDGLLYMFCILGILFAHEMGHFLMTLKHRIPASLPYFIPIPFSPIGTMGAVIGMDGLRADRKQLFDIGIAGPLAGLVVAVPIIIVGVLKMDMTSGNTAQYALDVPLVMAVLMSWFEVPGYEFGMDVSQQQLNPWFMAGWVGLLVTGLNMMPISQLDGGHITYTLFGKSAHWVARILLVIAYLFAIFGGATIWLLMLTLILIMGTDHPPTRDDSVELGPVRQFLGYASLSIPLLCFPPYGIIELI